MKKSKLQMIATSESRRRRLDLGGPFLEPAILTVREVSQPLETIIRRGRS